MLDPAAHIVELFATTNADTLVILGPTASGKSALGVAVAKLLNGEVISADSRQVYKGMDVGTGKITVLEMEGIPHHMIDIVSPDQKFTTADFVEKAQQYRQDILAKGKTPILVGGTGLYLSALIEGFSFAGERSDSIRNQLELRLEQEGIDILYEELKVLDPASAQQLGKENARYVLRALEVALTGATKSEANTLLENVDKFCVIGLNIEPEVLKEKINKRHAEMFDNDALLKETEVLLQRGYATDLESMTSIGYKECQAVLTGMLSREEAIAIVQAKARQYAKRQRTWFRRMEKRGIMIHWI